MRRPILLTLLAFLCLLVRNPRAAAPERLGPGSALQRTAPAGETVAFAVDVPAGRVMDVSVATTHGMPDLLILRAADGHSVVTADLSKRIDSSRRVLVPAGSFQIELRPSNHGPVDRAFAISASELTAADEPSRTRLAAEQQLGEGERAYREKAPGYLRTALQAYERSLASWIALGDKARQADALAHTGFVRYEQGEMKTALDTFEQAQNLAQAIDDRPASAAALYGRALVAGDSGQQKDAEAWANESLVLRRTLGDLRGQTDALFVLQAIRFITGRNDEVRVLLDEAIALSRQVGDRVREADGLNFLGVLEAQVGRPTAAIDLYRRALEIDRAEEEPVRAAQRLSNLGAAFNNLGDTRSGLGYLEQALPIRKALASPNSYGNTLYNVALTNAELGNYRRALEDYNEALRLFQRTVYPRGEGFVLRALGDLHLEMGDTTKAEQFFSRAAAKWRSISDRRGEALALNSLGDIARRRRQFTKAATLLRQALEISKTVGLRREEEQTHGYLARMAADTGDSATAAAESSAQLDLARAVGDKAGEADALRQQGAAWRRLGAFDKARDGLGQAIAVTRTAGLRMPQALSLDELARVERDAGRLPEADEKIGEALELIEAVGATAGNRESRMQFTAAHRRSFDLAIDLAMRRGDTTRGFALSERARARGLVDMMREARLDLRAGVDPALLQRERAIEELLDAKHERFTRLMSAPHPAAREADDRQAIDRLVDEYRAIEADLRIKSPAYATLMAPTPVTVADVQERLLDPATTLVEYWLGDDRSYAWVVDKTQCLSFELPARGRIAELVLRSQRAINARSLTPSESAEQRSTRIAAADAEFDRAAASLSRTIVAPLHRAIRGRALWIVSDGELEYVPIAALPRPGTIEPLITKFEIVRLPSATVTAVVRNEFAGRKPSAQTIAVFADPVFRADDERVSPQQAGRGGDAAQAAADIDLSALPRLRFSRDEADAIVALAPQGRSRSRLDFNANRTEAKAASLANFRFVHFATHAVLDGQHPELSGIVLSLVDRNGRSQDGYLRLHEIYNLRLNADLVVLSACDTGLGRAVRSEGLIGLVRGFMYAGSPQVVASLWSVRDRATTAFMQRLYDGLLRRGLTPAAALRAAQIETSRDPQWRQPYYWAAFTLQGSR